LDVTEPPQASEGRPGAPATFEISTDEAGRAVVSVRGEVDLASGEAFTAAVQQALRDSPGHLVFDLSEVRFIDSSGLAVLVYAANNADVRLRSASQIVRRLIEISGLSDVLTG
jgi:anti-anti-sigma factor